MCLWIFNYRAGQVVHQPLVQLFGFDNFYQDTIRVGNTFSWPIVHGLFKIYVELKPGDNRIHLSTSKSTLIFNLILSTESNVSVNFRLGSISFANHIPPLLKIQAKQFSFLTQLSQLVFDEILYKQTGTRYSVRFLIEKQYHHIVLLPDEFSHQHEGKGIFKEIYRQISANNLIPEPSVKLLLHSPIFSSLTFAYTHKNLVVFNLPEHFPRLPDSFEQFYHMIDTTNIKSTFYVLGAFLHELGHLFDLDHGHVDERYQTIMSSSEGFIESGEDFFKVTDRFTGFIFGKQCSCYRVPIENIASSFSQGVLSRQSQYLQSTCQSDTHCQCSLSFNNRSSNDRPSQCPCAGQYQFDIEHCQQLIDRFNEKKSTTLFQQ